MPFVIRFSHQGKTIAKLAKATYKLLQSAYPDIYTPRFITAFSKNKNLKDMLVSTKLQWTMDFYGCDWDTAWSWVRGGRLVAATGRGIVM